MGKFFRSAWSTFIGALTVAVSSLPLGDVVELVKSGEILGVIGAAIGGILIGAGRGTEEPEIPRAGSQGGR